MDDDDNLQKSYCLVCDIEMKATAEKMLFCNECNKTSENLADVDDYEPEIDKISEKIFLGNEDGSNEKEKLKELGVTHILICGNQLAAKFPDDFIYKKLSIEDNQKQNIEQYFEETFNFIDNAIKVYVHCAAGVCRSVSIVIAYLIKKENMSYSDALKLVKQKRRFAKPNWNFENQLKNYEKEVIKENF